MLSGCGKPKEAPPPPPPAPVPVTEPAPAVYKPKPSPTLAAIKARGWLSCGVNPGLAGFAYADDRGVWRGFDVDICRAVAAATLGDANAVRFTRVTAPDRFTALRAGKIDMLSRNTSLTLSRDAGEGVDFPAITYYDGQGFLAPKALGLASADELNGARVCVQKGTASETNLADYFQARGLKYLAVVVKDTSEALTRYQNDECDAFTADMGALASARSLLNSPNAHVILPTVISKEPLGPVVRSDDFAWFTVVKWVNFALINAEELGISSKNLDEALKSAKPDARRFTGAEGGFGKALGLDPDWAVRAVQATGNYAEIYERNLGTGSKLGIPRALNQLWNMGGVLYAPPMR